MGENVFQIVFPYIEEVPVFGKISQSGQSVQIICCLFKTPPTVSSAGAVTLELASPQDAVIRIVHCLGMSAEAFLLPFQNLGEPALRGDVGDKSLRINGMRGHWDVGSLSGFVILGCAGCNGNRQSDNRNEEMTFHFFSFNVVYFGKDSQFPSNYIIP